MTPEQYQYLYDHAASDAHREVFRAKYEKKVFPLGRQVSVSKTDGGAVEKNDLAAPGEGEPAAVTVSKVARRPAPKAGLREPDLGESEQPEEDLGESWAPAIAEPEVKLEVARDQKRPTRPVGIKAAALGLDEPEPKRVEKVATPEDLLAEAKTRAEKAVELQAGSYDRLGPDAGTATELAKRDVAAAAYGSPFTNEPDDKKLDELRTYPGQGSDGTYTASMNKALHDLQLNYETLALRKLRDSGADVTEDAYKAIQAEARDKAKREVFGIMGQDDQRKNVLVPLQTPEEMRESVRGGEVLGVKPPPVLAWEAITGNKFSDSYPSQLFSPFWATYTPGFTDTDLVDPAGRPIGPQKREASYASLLRLTSGLSTPAFTYLFNEDVPWNGWGGDEHLKHIQYGDDATQHIGDVGAIPAAPWLAFQEKTSVGRAISAATPWNDAAVTKGLLGLNMLLPVLFLEPDPVSASLGVVGAGARAIPRAESILANITAKSAADAARVIDEAEGAPDAVQGLWDATRVGSHDQFVVEQVVSKVRLDLAQAGSAEAAKELQDLGKLDSLITKSGQKLDEAVMNAELAAAKEGIEEQGAKAMRSALKAHDEATKAAAQASAAASAASRASALRVQELRASMAAVSPELRKIPTSPEAIEKFFGDMQALKKLGDDLVEEYQGLVATKKAIEKSGGRLKFTAAQADRMAEVAKQLKKIAARKMLKVSDASVIKAMADWRMSREAAAALKAKAAAAMANAAKVAETLKIPTEAAMARQAKHLAEATKAVGEAAEAAAAAGVNVDNLSRFNGMVADEFRRVASASKKAEKMFKAGTEKGVRLNWKDSAMVGALNADQTLDGPKFAKLLEQKYGVGAVQHALDPRLGLNAEQFLSGTTPVTSRGIETLREVELAAHAAKDAVRLGESAPFTSILKKTAEYGDPGPVHRVVELAKNFALSRGDDAFHYTPLLSKGQFVQNVAKNFALGRLRVGSIMEKAFDPIAARGFGSIGVMIRDAAHRGLERLSVIMQEVDGIARLHFRKAEKLASERKALELELSSLDDGTELPEAMAKRVAEINERLADIEQSLLSPVREYLTSNTKLALDAKGAHYTVMNSDPQTPADKCLGYLKMLLRGDADWSQDQVPLALARAWLPQSLGGELSGANAEAMALLRQIVGETEDGASFFRLLETRMRQPYIGAYSAKDVPQRAFRDIVRGVASGAAAHDTVFDTLRASGVMLKPEDAKVFNFMAEPSKRPLKDINATLSSSLEQAAATYGMAFIDKAQYRYDWKWLTGLAVDQRAVNNLLKLGEIEGEGIVIPRHIYEAIKAIPGTIAKDSSQTSAMGSWLGGLYARNKASWSLATVWGMVFPNPSQFIKTPFDDWAQTSMSVGVKAGVGTLGTIPGQIPWIGRDAEKAIDALGNKSIASSWRAGIVADVLAADSRVVVMTGDGPKSALQVAKEMKLDGVWSSISTQDLMELTNRTYDGLRKRGWVGQAVELATKPRPYIEDMARHLESAQLRQRAALYIDLITGKATGTALPRDAAKKLMLEALFDWKNGMMPWEAQTIGLLSVFWNYRRNATRQLSAILTEAISDPNYMSKAMKGQTKLARTLSLGEAASAVANTVLPQPEGELTDIEQLDEWGKSKVDWWVDAQNVLGGRGVSMARRQWFSKLLGRELTHEMLVAPQVAFLDNLVTMKLLSDTAMASAIHGSEVLGAKPNVTTIPMEEIVTRNLEAVVDSVTPIIKPFIEGGSREALGLDSDHGEDVVITKDQEVFLRRLGVGDNWFTRIREDGRVVMDGKVAAGFSSLAMALYPVFKEPGKAWALVDNPGFADGMFAGTTEGLLKYIGLMNFSGFDPGKNYSGDVRHKATQLKDEVRASEPPAVPRNRDIK